MELTKDDVRLIDEVERALSRSKKLTVVLFALLVLAIVMLTTSFITPTECAIACVGLTLCAILQTRISGPNQADIVSLLAKVRSQIPEEQDDPIIKAFSNEYS